MKWILESFVNKHGWVDYHMINYRLVINGYDIEKLQRHNMTDGEVHLIYKNKRTGICYELNANYWSPESFNGLFAWINNMEVSE